MSVHASKEIEAIKNLKQIAREEQILPGTAICGGCGGLEALRLATNGLSGSFRNKWTVTGRV